MRENSILFYYFNGSVNYINGIFSKCLGVRERDSATNLFYNVAVIWQSFLDRCSENIDKYPFEFDRLTSFTKERRYIALNDFFSKNNRSINSYSLIEELTVLQSTLRFSLADINDREQFRMDNFSAVDLKSYLDSSIRRSVYFIDSDYNLIYQALKDSLLYKFLLIFRPDSICDDDKMNRALISGLIGLSCSDKIRMIFPRYSSLMEIDSFAKYSSLFDSMGMVVYECYGYIAVAERMLESNELINGVGDRLWYFQG